MYAGDRLFLKQLYVYLKNGRYAMSILLSRGPFCRSIRSKLALCCRLLVAVAGSSDKAIKLEPIDMFWVKQI